MQNLLLEKALFGDKIHRCSGLTYHLSLQLILETPSLTMQSLHNRLYRGDQTGVCQGQDLVIRIPLIFLWILFHLYPWDWMQRGQALDLHHRGDSQQHVCLLAQKISLC